MFWKRKKQPDDEFPTPEAEIATARKLVERGELEHALGHLAGALRQEPLNQEARDLFRRMISMVRDPLLLAPLGRDETPDHIVGARAYIHAWRGELDQAVGMLVQIYRAVPGLPFYPWLLEWLSPPDAAESLEPNSLLQLVMTVCEKLDEPEVREQAEQLLPIMARGRAAHPEAAVFAAISSKLPRELGRLDEALEIARQAYKVSPEGLTATMMAGVYRAQGDSAGAIAAYRLGLQHDPGNVGLLLDIGDMLCNTGKLEEGLESYRQVLELEPDHAWAQPSLIYYQGLLEPEGPWEEQLQAYLDAHPGNQRAQYLDRQHLPYIAYLPEPEDATINVLRQLIDAEFDDPKAMNIGLSSLEAPSALRSVELHLLERFGESGLQVEVATIQKPDPRVPRGQVDYLLWRYRSSVPEPAVDPPGPEVQQALAWLAARTYTIDAWAQQGRETARQLGPERLPELLGAMVHPPPRDQRYPIWSWLLRVQLAACMTIASLDQGWQGSLRRRALLSLARGPMDWSVGAALVALAHIAEEETASLDEICALYLELATTLPRPGRVPYLHALLGAATRLPRMPKPLVDQLRKLFEEEE